MANLANITVEPCRIEWDGTDFGYTQGDIEITPEEQGVEVTAHQEGTNVLDMIRTGKTLELTVTLIETATSRLRQMLEVGGGASLDVAEVATLLCVADVSSSLHGTTFPLIAKDGTKYLFQLKTGSLVAPVIPGWTVVQITIAANDSANTVADAVAAAIDALAAFVAPNPAAATITITQASAGEVPSGSTAGNSGFTYTVTTAGSSDLSGWGGSKDFTGMLADSAKLVLHPISKDDLDLTSDIAFWKAYPMVGSIVKSGEALQTIAITFKIFPDLTKAKAIRLFTVGDHS
jgi:hypothetical protein